MKPEHEALLPCPFCGDAKSLIVVHVDGTVVHPAYFVQCDNCGACGPTTDRGDHRSMWNARAASPNHVALLAENAALRAQVEAQAVPGWKLVPVKPTEAMIEAAGEALWGHTRAEAVEWAKIDKFESQAERGCDAYSAMLAAAPQPQEQP